MGVIRFIRQGHQQLNATGSAHRLDFASLYQAKNA
jgi:hypothetical protein